MATTRFLNLSESRVCICQKGLITSPLKMWVAWMWHRAWQKEGAGGGGSAHELNRESSSPTCPRVPTSHSWCNSPENASWVRAASVLDLEHNAINKCSRRAVAQKTTPSASEKTHSSISQRSNLGAFQGFPSASSSRNSQAPPSCDLTIKAQVFVILCKGL